MTKTCPICGSEKFIESPSAIEFDENGIPWAGAASEGYGVPVWRESRAIIFKLDGEENRVVAFNRNAGWIIRLIRGPDGKLIRDKGRFAMEKVTGKVTAEWKSDV